MFNVLQLDYFKWATMCIWSVNSTCKQVQDDLTCAYKIIKVSEIFEFKSDLNQSKRKNDIVAFNPCKSTNLN